MVEANASGPDWEWYHCNWSMMCPYPPAGSFVKCLFEIQVCVCVYIYIYKKKYTAIHTYSASSLPENLHRSSKHGHQRPEKGHTLS